MQSPLARQINDGWYLITTRHLFCKEKCIVVFERVGISDTPQYYVICRLQTVDTHCLPPRRDSAAKRNGANPTLSAKRYPTEPVKRFSWVLFILLT